jgi:hypothetical protein
MQWSDGHHCWLGLPPGWQYQSWTGSPLFMHPQAGAQAADDAAYVIRLGRAYGIILILATQRPDATSLPTAISGNVSDRFCLKVPGQAENDIILGTSSYRNGYKATAFRTKTDAGLGWLKAEGEPQIVRTYYLDLPDCERVAARARVIRESAGALSGYALGADDRELPRSFAADVLSVFGTDDKLWCSTIAARLAERSPASIYADHHRGRRSLPAPQARRDRQERPRGRPGACVGLRADRSRGGHVMRTVTDALQPLTSANAVGRNGGNASMAADLPCYDVGGRVEVVADFGDERIVVG